MPVHDIGSSAASRAPGSGAATGIDWTSSGDRLECASVPVPLDWSDLGGEQINLAVIKKSASKPDQPIGTMFVGPGGPGDTAIGMVRGGGRLDGWGDGRFDVICWDPVAPMPAHRSNALPAMQRRRPCGTAWRFRPHHGHDQPQLVAANKLDPPELDRAPIWLIKAASCRRERPNK